jgi:protein-glutamine gamma-glutamyltransferase
MSAGVGATLRRVNHTRHPEDSVALRAATLGAVLTGVVTLGIQGAIGPAATAGALIALPIAYFVSHVRRDKDNWHIKIAIALGAVAALLHFFGQLRVVDTFDAIRFPLAEVFLWIQILHSFDLPQRKDLGFSLGSSLVLMATAATLSQDLAFGPLAVIYLGFALGALMLAQRSELREGVSLVVTAPGSSLKAHMRRATAKAMTGAAAAGAIVFLFIPQATSPRAFALPFSFGGGSGMPSGAGIANPAFPNDASMRSSGGAYFGVADRMDLRVRGELSDDLVMRVRASAPAMWRGAIFDTYNGVAWSSNGGDPQPLGGGRPVTYHDPLRVFGPDVAVSQTFYVGSEQPSVIFAAEQPEQIYYEGTVSADRLGQLVTDSSLTDGTVYSVLSARGAASASELRSSPPQVLGQELLPYLQLPPSLPDRVGSLARSITTNANTTYDKVVAIENYLREHYRYSLDSPVPPEGRDAVDHFLFDARTGFCEQFASAHAVMLRTLGIPARVVTGFTPGHRNLFTGYYEVRASDAHAWVEVYFPGYGWYEFDPTFDVPAAEPSRAEFLPIAQALKFLATTFARATPGGRAAVLLAIGGALGVVCWAALVLRRRFRTVPALATAGGLEEHSGPVGDAWRHFESVHAERGLVREPFETAAQFADRVGRGARLADAVDALHRERYSPVPPHVLEVRAAVAAFERAAKSRPGAGSSRSSTDAAENRV